MIVESIMVMWLAVTIAMVAAVYPALLAEVEPDEWRWFTAAFWLWALIWPLAIVCLWRVIAIDHWPEVD